MQATVHPAASIRPPALAGSHRRPEASGELQDWFVWEQPDRGPGGAALRAIERPSVALFDRHYEVLKRCLDLSLFVLLLPLSLPIMALCALAIWIDNPGPVLFTQARTGQRGHRFRMYKFRTMVTNAEALKVKYAHLNELAWPDFKITDDPRVTRVGRFLRRTSLDEFPQILNVLLGNMSFVGPRPTSFDVSTYALRHTERLEVKPGITGLWQVSGRADLDFDQRLELDVQYIENRNILFDLQLLARTVWVVFSGRGAY